MPRKNIVKDLESVLNHLEKELSMQELIMSRLLAKREILLALLVQYTPKKKKD